MAGKLDDVVDIDMAGKKIRVTWQDERYGGEKNVMAGSWWMELLLRHFCPLALGDHRSCVTSSCLSYFSSCRNSDLGIGFYCKKSAMRVRHCFSRAPRTSIAHKTVHHNHNKRASLFAHHSSTISTFISYGPLSRIDTSILLFIILPSPSSPSNHEDL